MTDASAFGGVGAKQHEDATQARGAFDAPVEILVNNAGIFPPATTLTVDEEMFDSVYAVNVKAPFFLTPGLAPEMQVMDVDGGRTGVAVIAA